MAYETINPFNNEKVKAFSDLTDSELEDVISQAQKEFTHWKTLSYAERGKILSKAASLLRKDIDKYAKILTLEMGKLIGDAIGEVELSADILDYYAENTEKFLAPRKIHPKEGGEAIIESQPIGILFGVQPWNFPYYQLARIAGPNLMAGNVLIVKHASNVPQSAKAFEALLLEAGAPKGLYSNVFATRPQIEKIIADPRIKGVALTGGEKGGAAVASEAGKALKKSTMELGGSDAFIVLEDANMDKAIKWAVWGRMNNTGQCCVAAKRFIVVEKVADEFIRRFKEELAKLEPGDPMDKSTTLGPVCSESAAVGLQQQIDRAVKNGAKVILGGHRIQRPGAFIEPTILTDIAKSNPVYYEEFFGPVAMIFRVPDDKAAVELANDSPFGLGGSIITENVEHGKALARQIETGMVFINQSTWTAPDLPFGGVKISGYGRELAELGVHEFVNKKLIRVHEGA
ncbi:NAD-dependent succinate-semialdehyde dehydrogenase [Entomobacter blattae]|uniref:Succinate-semialdehyde dehydrogenase [NADP(+)] 1 n=1 Tax=Entomobacter blattae TaxID=2762277 RepID=A0A7H1NQF6_9PROT|nr:NAD-dependent succinate-semialdehyde dehydrogenase [Entomobacter blattae]QNT78016.1 Succinate-semialdehyde dehydrogenase [NADP(+)] 1 [Entomobacter blattae]